MSGQVELQWLDKWSYNGWISGVTMAGQVELQWLDKWSYNGWTSGVTMAGQVEFAGMIPTQGFYRVACMCQPGLSIPQRWQWQEI